MSKKLTMEAADCFEAEVLGKDLGSWLGDPDGTRSGSPFSTLEEWTSWWDRDGARFRDRALRLFEQFATARADAGIEPTEEGLGPPRG